MVHPFRVIDESGVAVDPVKTSRAFEDFADIGLKDEAAVAQAAVIHQSQRRVLCTSRSQLRIEVLDVDASPVFALLGVVGRRDHHACPVRAVRHAAMPHPRVSKAHAACRDGHSCGGGPLLDEFPMVAQPIGLPIGHCSFTMCAGVDLRCTVCFGDLIECDRATQGGRWRRPGLSVATRIVGRLPRERSVEMQWLIRATRTVHVSVVEPEPRAPTEHPRDYAFDQRIGDQFRLHEGRMAPEPELQMALGRVPLVLGRLSGGPNALHVIEDGPTEKIGGLRRDQLLDNGIANGVDVSDDRRQRFGGENARVPLAVGDVM